MTEKREVEVVYRRWTILIPVLLMVIGGIIMFGFWSVNAIVALLGGMLILAGVLSLGILLVMIISFELGTRKLQRQRRIPPALSEDFEKADREKETRAKADYG